MTEKQLKKQEKLSKLTTLRFDKNIKPKSLTDILYKLLHAGNMYTLNTFRGKLFTYNSKTNRRSGNFMGRSREDAFRLAKYYIPDIKFDRIEQCMNMLSEHHFCSTSGKRIYNNTSGNDLLKRVGRIKEQNLDIKIK